MVKGRNDSEEGVTLLAALKPKEKTKGSPLLAIRKIQIKNDSVHTCTHAISIPIPSLLRSVLVVDVLTWHLSFETRGEVVGVKPHCLAI